MEDPKSWFSSELLRRGVKSIVFFDMCENRSTEQMKRRRRQKDVVVPYHRKESSL